MSFPWEGGDKDTYAGTTSNVRASYQSPRRARGKYRGNATRKPSWISNPTLEVLKFGTRTSTPRATRDHAKPRIVQPNIAATYYDRIAQFGAVGNID